jgi:N-dimethylarginine dimethylaminohydrolase
MLQQTQYAQTRAHNREAVARPPLRTRESGRVVYVQDDALCARSGAVVAFLLENSRIAIAMTYTSEHTSCDAGMTRG